MDPYLRLMRVDQPIGTWLLFWPCGWGLSLAAPPGCLPDLHLLAIFAAGSFVMRGAGCTINDMWDRRIDQKVARTRLRPLSSNKITQFDALVLLAGELGLGLLILLQLNWPSVLLGMTSLAMVLIYPLAKRFTYWPQLVLGLTFNWGAVMGWVASEPSNVFWITCLPIYAAGICWTLIYDTIYAHQDKYDDKLLGLFSTALRFGDQGTKKWLTCFATGMILNLLTVGHITEQTWPFYASVVLVSLHLVNQISTLRVNDPQDCAHKFKSNRYVGGLIFLGITIGSLQKATDLKNRSFNPSFKSWIAYFW